jgi:hypothetical protein
MFLAYLRTFYRLFSFSGLKGRRNISDDLENNWKKVVVANISLEFS